MLARIVQRRPRSQRGQAITEFALAAPLLFLLLLGAFDASNLASNKVTSISAVRHGARLGAQLGGTGNPPGAGSATCKGTLVSGTSEQNLDNQVLNDVLAGAFERKDVSGATAKHLTGLFYADVTEIDIYRPQGNPDGSFNQADHANRYTITTQTVANVVQPAGPFVKQASGGAKPGYPLSERCQGLLGSEAEFGVSVTWTYHAPNKLYGNLTFIDYAVEKMSLCANNCL